MQDIKYGLWMHRRTLNFTAIALLTLAVGIGASTAVFSVINAILLKPLPYPGYKKIVLLWRSTPAKLNLGYNEIPWNMRSVRLFLRESKAFQYLGAFKSDSFNLTGSGEPALLEGFRVSAGFFPSLNVTPALGRTFTPDEDRVGHEHEVVLSHQLWHDRFGGDPRIVGRILDLSGAAYTIIGVMQADFSFPHGEEMPGSFNFPRRPELWVPLALPEVPPTNTLSDLALIARLQPNITVAQAQEEMNLFAKLQDEEFPRYKGWFNSRVISLAHQVAGDSRRPLLLMFAAVGAVLLISCSNIANLLLVRLLARRRELALRASLGASHGRLIRQILTENFLLTVAAGVIGILVAQAGIQAVKILGPSSIPRLQEVSLDLPVFAFGLGISLVVGILSGLPPAVGATRKDLVQPLKENGGRSAGSLAGLPIRRAFIISEIAMAFVLVVGAALLSRTFFLLLGVDAGFKPQDVLTFELPLPAAKYSDQQRIVAFYHIALQRIQSLPGVRSAGLIATTPMDGATEGTVLRLPDRAIADNEERPVANYNIASPSYFSTVGTPLLRGRDFLETDSSDTMQVTIINNAMAKKFWPDSDPIGKQVGLGNPRLPFMTIVGIVADVKHLSLREEPGPEMYVPYTQKPYPSMLAMHIVLGTEADPILLTASVRAALHAIDPDVPLAKVTTLVKIVENSMAQARFSVLLLASFSALALLLACVGLYAAISNSVSQRTQEIGIRMALGAREGTIMAMVLSQGARLGGMGVVLGLAAAFGLTRMMAGFLYEIKTTDPLTFAAVSLLLFGVCLFACYFPARRAATVDPAIALRHQ